VIDELLGGDILNRFSWMEIENGLHGLGSDIGDFFPHVRSSMSVTGNIANSSFSASPDLIQMKSAGSATTTITLSGNNIETGNYKMVAGFTDRGLNYYQGQFFDLTIEDDSSQTILVIAIITIIAGIAVIALFRVRSRSKEKER